MLVKIHISSIQMEILSFNLPFILFLLCDNRQVLACYLLQWLASTNESNRFAWFLLVFYYIIGHLLFKKFGTFTWFSRDSMILIKAVKKLNSVFWQTKQNPMKFLYFGVGFFWCFFCFLFFINQLMKRKRNIYLFFKFCLVFLVTTEMPTTGMLEQFFWLKFAQNYPCPDLLFVA